MRKREAEWVAEKFAVMMSFLPSAFITEKHRDSSQPAIGGGVINAIIFVEVTHCQGIAGPTLCISGELIKVPSTERYTRICGPPFNFIIFPGDHL